MPIVDEIYESLTDDEAFAALPDRFARLVDARSCMLQAFAPEGDLLFAVDNGYFSPESLAFYADNEMHRHDPWREQVERRNLWNRAFSSAALIDPEAYKRSILYNEVFRRFGDDTAHCLSAGMTHRAGRVELGIHRGMTSETFSEEEVAVIQPTIPHLRRLLMVRARLHVATSGAATARAIVDKIPHAILVLDRTSRLSFANGPGDALLSSGRFLTQRGAVVAAPDHRIHERFSALVRAAALGQEPHGGAVMLREAAGATRRAVVAPWRTGFRTHAIVLIEDADSPDAAGLAVRLAGLYSLTAAEANTVAALAEGLSPGEVADGRGVALATVRTQIQQALRKTEVRTIADLVRLAVTLPRLQAPPA